MEFYGDKDFKIYPRCFFSYPINAIFPKYFRSGKTETAILNNSEVQKRKISASEILLLPEEKKLHFRNNPNLYILDESIHVVLQ